MTTMEDPRLTAYALGDLSDAEHLEFESLMSESDALAADVAQVQAFAGRIAASFAAEDRAVGMLSARERDKIRLQARWAGRRWVNWSMPQRALPRIALAGMVVVALGLFLTLRDPFMDKPPPGAPLDQYGLSEPFGKRVTNSLQLWLDAKDHSDISSDTHDDWAPERASDVMSPASLPGASIIAANQPVPEAPALEGATPLPSAPGAMVIKDAQMTLEVASLASAMSRVEAAAAQAAGYVLETTADYGSEGSQGATIKLAVPVEAFDATRDRIRQAATKVVSEHASGSDVSQEAVDIRAQIANLQATSARVRSFLDDADSVEEALRVNAELTRLEGQIAQHQARLDYLEQRSAFSTITVEMYESALAPTSTPTPAVGWSPMPTVRAATTTMRTVLQGLASLAIWFGIVVLPLLVIWGGVLLVSRWVWRRWSER